MPSTPHKPSLTLWIFLGLLETSLASSTLFYLRGFSGAGLDSHDINENIHPSKPTWNLKNGGLEDDVLYLLKVANFKVPSFFLEIFTKQAVFYLDHLLTSMKNPAPRSPCIAWNSIHSSARAVFKTPCDFAWNLSWLTGILTHRIHVWYIYPHLVYFCGKCR